MTVESLSLSLVSINVKCSIRTCFFMASRRWATTISRNASCLYFFLIIFQIPLYRVPCRDELCTTPLELTCCQLFASDLFPTPVVATLLYPGAVAKAILKTKHIPSFNGLPKLYKFIDEKAAAFPVTSDLQRLEVIVGSYLAVAGAIINMVRPGRMSLFGSILVVWGICKTTPSHQNLKTANSMYPTMLVAVILAFLSVRKDVRRIERCIRSGSLGRPSWKKPKYK